VYTDQRVNTRTPPPNKPVVNWLTWTVHTFERVISENLSKNTLLCKLMGNTNDVHCESHLSAILDLHKSLRLTQIPVDI